METFSGPMWAIITAVGGALLSTIGVLWKLYLDANKDKERIQKEKLDLVIDMMEKRKEDGDKNIEMLFKVQHALEQTLKFSDKLGGMISKAEKMEIVTSFKEIQQDVREVRERLLND